MEAMHAHNCRHLPVSAVAGGGVPIHADLMHYELASKTEELHHMRAYIHATREPQKNLTIAH